jgi:hypothetical protein
MAYNIVHLQLTSSFPEKIKQTGQLILADFARALQSFAGLLVNSSNHQKIKPMSYSKQI